LGVGVVGVCFDGPVVHVLGPVVLAADVLEEDSVEAEYVGVGGVCFDGPLVHVLSPVVIVANICEKESVRTE